jgi:signal transduction histidine kinase
MPFRSATVKQQRIQMLRYIVASRWVLHALIVVLGLIQKAIGVADFNWNIFGLLAITYSYNFVFYLYLHRNPNRITQRGLFAISVVQVVFDQIVYSIVLYASGGVESLSFLFYFLTIFMAIVLFNELQIIALMLFTVALYVSVLMLEYEGIIPHLPRYHFDPGFYQNIGVTVHNAATVVLIMVFTSFFAAFINNLIRQREEDIESERDKVVAIVNNLVDGIILLDHRGRVALMNPYAQRLLALRTREYTNTILTPNKFKAALRPLVEFIQSATKEPVYESSELTIEDGGEHVIIQATALQVTDTEGANIGSLVILRNVTKEKDLDQMKSDFISVAAHQLRTPLSTLKWLFKLLLDGDGGAMTAKQTDLISKGYQRNEEVIEIVNNLLDVSEIEGGRLPLTFVSASLTDLLKELTEASRVHALRKEVNIEYQQTVELPAMKIDRQKLKMALQNLIENGIKYSYPKQTVTVSVGIDNDEAIVKIKDTGIGMSDETKDKLFTKFFRGREAVNKDPSGSGLGLYIVRNIIEKHGGSIDLESTLGKGTTFIIRLPIT